MKQKIKYLIGLIIIFIVFITINSFLFGNKINQYSTIKSFLTINKQQNNNLKAIFNIISKSNINISNNLDLKGETELYKNIENINIIGKGFFINDSGEFLTAKHLFINKNNNYYIEINKTNYNFKILKEYKNKDIVLGKIQNYENKYFLNTKLNKHDYLIYEKLKIFTYTNNKKIIGKIIGIGEIIKELRLNNLIKTDIRLSPGDSGSPLLNKEGKVIGIFIAIKLEKNISYAQIIK